MTITTKEAKHLQYAATPGQWLVRGNSIEGFDVAVIDNADEIAQLWSGSSGCADDRLIVLAVNNLVPVCEERDRLREAFEQACETAELHNWVPLKQGVATSRPGHTLQCYTTAQFPYVLRGTRGILGLDDVFKVVDLLRERERDEPISQQDAEALRASSCLRQVLRLIEKEPVEPGETHPAETLLAEAPWPTAGRKIAEAFQEHADVRRSLLLLVGRLPRNLYTEASGLGGLISEGLKQRDVLVREAAVRSAETLGSDALGLLRSHHDENEWLREYISQLLG